MDATRLYLESVYRKLSHLPGGVLETLLLTRQFLYKAPLGIDDPLPVLCFVSEEQFSRPSCGTTRSLGRVGWHHRLGWRSLNSVGMYIVPAIPYSCGPRPDWPEAVFARDNEWAEVVRSTSMSKAFGDSWSEGGGRGCWFFLSKGSGVHVNVGRSLRAANRSDVCATLLVARPQRAAACTPTAQPRS